MVQAHFNGKGNDAIFYHKLYVSMFEIWGIAKKLMDYCPLVIDHAWE